MKLLVKTQSEGELKTIAERDYESTDFQMPEPRSVLTIPELDDDEGAVFWIVQNVIHHLGADQPEVHLVVQDQEEMIRDMREQRARMAQLQQLAGGSGAAQAAASQQGGQLWTP